VFSKQFVTNFEKMFSRLIAYLLLATMLTHSFSQVVIVADYVINSELITKVFCVNKEKPAMKCNGKCHLAKQLEKDEEKKSVGKFKNDEFQMIFESAVIGVVYSENIFLIPKTERFYYNRSLLIGQNNSVFHPPSEFA
jgi:hypothetical protein